MRNSNSCTSNTYQIVLPLDFIQMVGDLVWNLMMLAMVFPRLAILDWQGGSLMET